MRPKLLSFNRSNRSVTALLALCMLGACSNYSGSWPQLGPSAQDVQPSMDNDVAAAAVPARAPSVVDETAMQDLVTRLSQVTVSFADARERAKNQRSAVLKAVDRAGSETGSSWSRAQLELSRLNQIDAELAELRDDASGIAGDLAAMSARGMPVDEEVGMTGTLINKISKTLQEIAATRTRARSSLMT